MFAFVLDAVVEAVAWILSFFFGGLPERPLWLRRLVALIYVVVFVACVVGTIMVLV